MRTDTEGLSNKLPTMTACLCREARVHSDHLMTSSLSLIFKDIEKRTPTGIANGFCEMVILDHPTDIEVFNHDMVIVIGILLSRLVMEVTALPLDLEMCLGSVASGLAIALAALLAAAHLPLLAPQRLLAFAVVAWVRNRVPFAIRQERFQSDIDPDIRMRTGRRAMFSLWVCFTDDECVPVTISTMHEVSRLGRSLDGPMHLDLDGAAQLLGERQMLPVRGKREIGLVLSQLNGMPAIWLLEPGKAALLTEFSQRKEPFEGLVQAICQHLDRGSGYMLTPTATKLSGQIVFQEECVCLLIVLFGGGQHLIVEMPRRDQAPHEGFGLGFIRIDSVLKRSHGRHFAANELSCQVEWGPTGGAVATSYVAAFGGREKGGGEGTSRSVKGLAAPCNPASSRSCNNPAGRRVRPQRRFHPHDSSQGLSTAEVGKTRMKYV